MLTDQTYDLCLRSECQQIEPMTYVLGSPHTGLTLEGDSGEEVALWLLTSLCTSAKREVEVAL